MHDDTLGTADYNSDTLWTPYVDSGNNPPGFNSYYISRTFLPIDTSKLPDALYINSSTFHVYKQHCMNSDNDGNDFVFLAHPMPNSLQTFSYINNLGERVF